MYAAKRPRSARSLIILLLVASIILVACGRTGINTNWPGLSTDGGMVYVAYGPGVIAYDAFTQEQAWQLHDEEGRAQFYAAPSIKDGRVIVGDYGASSSFSPRVNVSLYALPAEQSGIPVSLWKKEQLANGSIVASPLQVGDRVFVGTADNFVYALNANTGELLWPEPFETGDSIWGKPAFKDGLLVVNSLDKTVYGIDAESGSERWRRELGGALASAPVVNLNLVYVASFDRNLHALDLETGEEVWAAAAEDWIWSAPAYSDGVVYFADAKGNVFAVDGESGERMWVHPIDKPIQTSPVVVDDVIYVGSEADGELSEGLLTALAANGGDVIWQKRIPAPLYTTPVVVDDVIVVAIQAESALLMAFDLENGDEAWTIPQPGSGN